MPLPSPRAEQVQSRYHVDACQQLVAAVVEERAGDRHVRHAAPAQHVERAVAGKRPHRLLELVVPGRRVPAVAVDHVRPVPQGEIQERHVRRCSGGRRRRAEIPRAPPSGCRRRRRRWAAAEPDRLETGEEGPIEGQSRSRARHRPRSATARGRPWIRRRTAKPARTASERPTRMLERAGTRSPRTTAATGTRPDGSAVEAARDLERDEEARRRRSRGWRRSAEPAPAPPGSASSPLETARARATGRGSVTFAPDRAPRMRAEIVPTPSRCTPCTVSGSRSPSRA